MRGRVRSGQGHSDRQKHNLNLALGAEVFASSFIEEEDARLDYGEARFVAIGPVASLGDRICAVVYTWRAGERWLISFRKPMSEKLPDTVKVTPEVLAAARAEITPDLLACFDALSDDEIAKQVA